MSYDDFSDKYTVQIDEPYGDEADTIFEGGEEGPPIQHDELCRYSYLQHSRPIKIKVEKKDGGATTYYRVMRNGVLVGWQLKKPGDYHAILYFNKTTSNLGMFFWPSEEKDVDTLEKLNLRAFTFGDASDGLPSGAKRHLEAIKHRQLVILTDGDKPNRKHAEERAALAYAAGVASIKIVKVEIPVATFLETGGTADQLMDRVAETPLWAPPADTPAEQPPNDDANKYRLEMRCMTDVKPEKIEWLWPGRIAVGKQTLIGGEPGLGKSQVTAALAATVTSGGTWPCDEGRSPLGSVIILSAEDDASDTIRPRLDAAGADVSRIHLISAVHQNDGKGRRTFNLQADLVLLEKAIQQIGDVRLVIIDPVSSYLGKTDSHNNSEVRSTLAPLGEMAARLRTAVVAVTHFNKGAGQSAVNSFIGSIAFIANARTAFVVTRDPDDDTRRLFVQAKNNIAANGGGLAFRVEQHLLDGGIVASGIAWESEKITRTADEILAAGRDTSEAPERSEAEAFLRDMLADGPRPAAEIEAEAKGASISTRTLRRARNKLKIKSYRKAETGEGLGSDGRWYWALPADATKVANSNYDGHRSDAGVLGGHVSGPF
jgi:AAA domain-containing protein